MNRKNDDKPYDGLRDTAIRIRVTNAEKAAVIEGAKRAKLSQSDYLISLVMKDLGGNDE